MGKKTAGMVAYHTYKQARGKNYNWGRFLTEEGRAAWEKAAATVISNATRSLKRQISKLESIKANLQSENSTLRAELNALNDVLHSSAS